MCGAHARVRVVFIQDVMCGVEVVVYRCMHGQFFELFFVVVVLSMALSMSTCLRFSTAGKTESLNLSVSSDGFFNNVGLFVAHALSHRCFPLLHACQVYLVLAALLSFNCLNEWGSHMCLW